MLAEDRGISRERITDRVRDNGSVPGARSEKRKDLYAQVADRRARVAGSDREISGRSVINIPRRSRSYFA